MQGTNSLFNKSSLWCGVFSCVICIFSRIIFDSPLEMIHIVKGISLLPSIWIYNLISYAWFFLIGVAAGAIMESTKCGSNNGHSEICAYRGGLFFLSCFFISLILYHLFFILNMLFLSLIISAVSLMCTLLCAVQWSRVRPHTSSVIMYSFSVWQFYMFFVCLSVFINN